MDKILGQGMLLSYPNFSEIFIIFADAFTMKLRIVIRGKWESVASYSDKLTPTQINYTTSVRKMLRIVETLE